MSKTQVSIKHIQIDKNQSIILGAAAIAAFLLVFSAVAGKSLVDQIIYNNRVITAKKAAVTQLRTNTQTTEQLVSGYKAFVGTSQNVLGGNPQGSGPRDGDNAKIVLNALPSKYDFPALTTSIEKLVTGQGLKIESMTGNDDEVAQAANQSSPSPKVIDMPFQVVTSGTYDQTRAAIDVFGKSIRPFQAEQLQVEAGQNGMTLTYGGKSYYQPAKNFNVTKKVVK